MRTRWLAVTAVTVFAMLAVLGSAGSESELAAVGEPVFDLRAAPLGAPGPVRVEPGSLLEAPVAWDRTSWSAVLDVTGEPSAVLETHRRQLVGHWPRVQSRAATDPAPVGSIATRHVGGDVLHSFQTLNDGTYFEDDSYIFELVERRGEARPTRHRAARTRWP